MYDVLSVHVLDTFTNLSHEENTVALREGKVVCDYALEQLAAANAATINVRGKYAK